MGTFVLPHLTSRLSVGSWPPKLPRSAFEAHWPPLEVRYLGYIRIASSDGVYPLTCAKADGGSVSCVSAINAAIAGAWLLPSAPSLSHSPPHDAYQLSHSQPHPKIQKKHLTITSSHPE